MKFLKNLNLTRDEKGWLAFLVAIWLILAVAMLFAVAAEAEPVSLSQSITAEPADIVSISYFQIGTEGEWMVEVNYRNGRIDVARVSTEAEAANLQDRMVRRWRLGLDER